MGKKYYIPDGTSFTYYSNTQEFFYTTNATYTNGYLLNSNINTVIYTNYTTNIWTNALALAITNPAALATISLTNSYIGTNSAPYADITGFWYQTNSGGWIASPTSNTVWTIPVDTTGVANGEFIFEVMISNAFTFTLTRTITNYVTNS